MSRSPRWTWLRAALLVGVLYFLIGRGFSIPATHVKAWRLAAWIVSMVVYAAHLGQERLKSGSGVRAAAWHVALAVAIGAFALAAAGMIHSLSSAAGFRPTWFLALVLWPLITAIPAFLVALAAGAALLPGRRG